MRRKDNKDSILVYIACPYTIGDVAVNVHRAIKCAERIASLGAIPYVPIWTHFWHIIAPKPYEFWMKLDSELLLRCDCVFRLEGESIGADREIKLAESHDIPVFYDYEKLLEYIKGE